MMSLLRNDHLGKLVLRLCLGGLMLFHGIAKILRPEPMDMIIGHLVDFGLPAFFAYGVYVGEILAPLMLIVGNYCRLGAALIVINMLFAIGLFHMHDIFALSDRGGSWGLELQGFYLFNAIALVFLGSGKYAFRPD